MSVEARLSELNITLPEAAAPAANYVPYLVDEKTVYISGQLPMAEGQIAFKGKVGESISEDDAVQAAKLCAINILAQLKAAIGDLEKVEKCLKLEIFVNATNDYTDHPKVGNGASNLIVDVLGDAGKHSRFAMGAGSLPFGVPVEIGATFKIK